MKLRNKPTLEDLFIACTRYVGTLDSQHVNQNVEDLKIENDTFFDRALTTFVRIALDYYDEKTIMVWIRENLLDLKPLPKLNKEGNIID